MNGDLDPALEEVFSNAKEALSGDMFTERVVQRTHALKRRAMAGRAALALALALLGIPVQDVALELSQVLMVTLVPIANTLAAQLLAPVNTAAGLLSVVLLVIRAAHRRLFR